MSEYRNMASRTGPHTLAHPRWPIAGVFLGIGGEGAVIELGIAQLTRSGLNLDGKPLEAIRAKILALLPSSQVSRIEPDTDAVLEAEGYEAKPWPRQRPTALGWRFFGRSMRAR